MVWFSVVENEDENVRLPAAVGVICASDLNEAETRVLSPGEQQEINNIIQQFITIQNTQVTNIDQVINIINNVTTNGTTGPVTPPTNDTGGGSPTACLPRQSFNSTSGKCEQQEIVFPECTPGESFNSTSGKCEDLQVGPLDPGTLSRQVPGEGDTGPGPQGGVTEEPPSGNDTGGG